MTVTAEVWRGGKRVLKSQGVVTLVYSFFHFLNGRRQLRSATKVGAIRLRGRAIVHNQGEMVFGDRLRLNGDGVPLQFTCEKGAHLHIGDGTFINYGADISAVESVTIGQRCNIGQYAIIIDADYHDLVDHTLPGKVEPVVIEDDVWLGARVTVLRGVRIGRGSVIAAHSLVMDDVPPYTLAAGSPAKVVRSLLPAEREGIAVTAN